MNSTENYTLVSSSLNPRLQPQRLGVLIALALLAMGTIVMSTYGWKHSILFVIGGFLGITLRHFNFGFASAYRKLFTNREVKGVYAQLVMLGIATIFFALALSNGVAFGQELKGALAPIGVQGAIGALLFGIGMQLGGACGCGTLYTIGGGSFLMLITLFTFCIGSFWASLTRQKWESLPSIPPISLGQMFGWSNAVLVQLLLFLLLAGMLWWWRKDKKWKTEEPQEERKILNIFSFSFHNLLHGPWSLLTGAIALAVLNWLTLLLSGRPWRVTWGFTLWSAQLATIFGWNPESSPFWSNGPGQQALEKGVFADVSSVMNIGIVLGSLLAAAFAGRLALKVQLDLRTFISALLGGLLMGYGASLASGCNVSAFFSGIASTSLHGWVWIFCALVGTKIGISIRHFFYSPHR